MLKKKQFYCKDTRSLALSTITLESHNFEIGSIQNTKKEIKVAVADGFININYMKLPGKRNMQAKDLLNGYEFKTGSKML